MPEKIILQCHIDPAQAGTYFTIPFTMPEGVETFSLAYHYPRHIESEEPVANGHFIKRQEANIIDLGLLAPGNVQVGASGSDKTEITLSETHATPGYRPHPLLPGEWQILVGAYKVAPEGVTVTYELTFTPKHLRLLKGDLHTHTLASDGVLTAAELAWHAKRHGLDFVAITDHNQMSTTATLPQLPDFTLIPGVEWTHYQGHANFLGVDRPYDEPFAANTVEEIQARFFSARERGALISINHPFEPNYAFRFDLNALPFDCLEVWNGPMRESNLRAIALWQSLLEAGKKVPICGGSDYHRSTPFLFLGGPTTCVYAMSAGPGDILDALRHGHAFIIFAPHGPKLEMSAGDGIMGDTVRWDEVNELQIDVRGLLAGDEIRLVKAGGSETLLQAPSPGRFRLTCKMESPGFARIEILRAFLPGIPPLPALLSNPIYFDGNLTASSDIM